MMEKKIVTLTFSPCIDKSTTVPSLVPEKKLKCTKPKLDPGGGGLNVARAIKKLGGEATAIYPSGGYTGKFLNHLVEREKIPTVIIETDQETRENIIVFDVSGNKQYRLGFPGTPLTESDLNECIHAIEDQKGSKYIVVSGSLPPGVPSSVYKHISDIAQKLNAKLIVDAPGEYLTEVVRAGVYLIKPNIGELAGMVNKERIEFEEIPSIAQNIISKSNCEIIVVSLGKNGAMLFTKDKSYFVKAPAADRLSTVGAGDSMVAGIVYSLSLDFTLYQALQYGVACGTAATLQPGTELCDKENADALYKIIVEG